MSTGGFGVLFLAGTAAVALWIDSRFPRLAPSDLRRALLRTLVAVAIVQLLLPSAWDDAIEHGTPMVALFLVAFPCLGYLLLSGIWAMRQLQALMRGLG